MLEPQLRINPAILKIIEDKGLNPEEVLLTLFSFRYLNDSSCVRDAEILNDENEDAIRLHFLNRDHFTSKWVLRIPLHTLIEPDEYQTFITKLIDEELGSYGLSSNLQTYPVFNDDDELQLAYDVVKMKLGADFDQDKLVETIIGYYTHGSSPRGLTKYMITGVVIDYRNGNVAGPLVRGVY